MPFYGSAVHGVRLSWEYLESAATSNARRVMLHTFELYHPLSGRHRFVQHAQELVARIEDTAEADAGQLVTFIAAPIVDQRPEMSGDAATPEMTLNLDQVAGLMAAELDKARGSTVPWTITERVYASDDVTYPHILPPTVFEVANTQMQGPVLGIQASFGSPANVNVPRITFKRANYPCLVR